MAKKSLTEHQVLKDLARQQFFDFDPSEDDSYAEEEIMEKECDKPWPVPTRDARDLILAEEIIRFASITDRPCTSQTQTAPDSTSDTLTPDSEPFPCKATRTPDKASESKRPESVVADKERTSTVTGATSKVMYIASETGTSGSEPPQSASFGSSQPSASFFLDAYLPEGEAKIPIDPQPKTRPSAIPVTNRILAAIAQSKLEQPSSSAPVILQQVGSVETKDYSPKNNAQLFRYFLENAFQESALSRSSSPESLAPAGLSPSERSDELSALKLNLSLTVELEERITKNMKRERVEIDEGNKYYPQANQQEAIPTGRAVNTCNQPVVENPCDNDFQHFDGNDLNVDVEFVPTTDDNDAAQPEFPEEFESLGLEWTRQEKRRLGIVIRDLSREIKTKELQQKKSRLVKKGRDITKAIENKMYDLSKEITSVSKKPLRYVALPLDKIQEYDWVRVAAALNAKRSPEECRAYWKCLLHPAINGSDWNGVEMKAMELIAHRHNFRNWDDIATELNTGRTGYQCYSIYRTHLCPHPELRDTRNTN